MKYKCRTSRNLIIFCTFVFFFSIGKQSVAEKLKGGTTDYHAVIVGISDYEGTINDLNYCDDDAQAIYARLLQSSHWSTDNIALILNSSATESNIHSALQTMGSNSDSDDVCLFYFSGHGGQRADDVSPTDESDGKDEYICPYNISSDQILDDELSDWLDDLPTDKIIVWLDTCYSGGNLKGPGFAGKCVSWSANQVGEGDGFIADLKKRGIKDVDDLTSPYISTACDDDETSLESSSLTHGLYTYYLLEALDGADDSGNGWVSGEESFDYLYPRVVAYESTQHPQEYDAYPGQADVVIEQVSCPFTEDFESGVVPDNGWSIQSASVGVKWQASASYNHTGSYGAYCPWVAADHDEWLITPSIDLTSFATPVLSFWWEGSYYWMVDPNDNADYILNISTNGGSSWNPIWSEENEGNFTSFKWDLKTVDLSAYDSYSNVKFAWRYVGNDSADVALDDVRICEASSVPTPTPPIITPTPKPTATAQKTATPTPKPTATAKKTATPTPKPTATVKKTATPTPKPTATAKRTASPTPKPTITQPPPVTSTPTPIVPVTPSPQPTTTLTPPPPATWTPTPSKTPKATPTPTIFVSPTPPDGGFWYILNMTVISFGALDDQPLPADYNGDGVDDIAVYQPDNGLWKIRNMTAFYYGTFNDQPLAHDFDGDGTCDVTTFKSSDGSWSVRGVTTVYFGGSSDDVPVVADYDGDHTCDFAYFRPSTSLWDIRNLGSYYFGSAGDQPVPGDYNGDGTCEMAVFRTSNCLWVIRHVTRVSFGFNGSQPVPRDYTGNGATDIAYYRPETGLWAVLGYTRVYYGLSGDQPVPADYDGDGRANIACFGPGTPGYPTPTPPPSAPPWIYDYDGDGTSDIAIFRESSGLWAVRGVTRTYFGSGSDITVPGDYNGNGTTDIGIFRSSSGLWAVRGVTRAYFGASSDLPVPGDYDGDGCCDAAVFRESSGLWALRGISRIYFGGASDEVVPGYYNGDGSKDVAIFRPASGLWAIRGISRLYFGSSTDTVVPGDYDGNGTWSPAIFRSASGLWAVRGVTRSYFGGASDQPVPADFDGNNADDIGIFRETSGLWAIRGLSRVYYGSSGDIPVTR